MKHTNLQAIVDKVASNKQVFGAVFYVSSDDGVVDTLCASGNIRENSRYYIASINKMMVSAIILKLCFEEKINIDDKIAKYLSGDAIQGLHIYNGTDYSKDISVLHLLSQTSGLPDYLEDKQANGRIAMKELEAGIDQPWPVSRVIDEV